MIIQFILLFIFVFFLTIQRIAQKKNSTKFILFIICVYSILFVGFRDGEKVWDYSVYQDMYDNNDILVEPTFLAIRYFCKEILNSNIILLMFIYALLAISTKFIAIYKYSTSIFLSLLIWFGNLFFIQDFTQIRAAVSISIFLLSIDSLYKHKKEFFLYCFIALLFHTSSLLMIPLWFLSSKTIKVKKWIFFVGITYGLALFKIDLISLFSMIPIDRVQERFISYRMARVSPANVFSILQIGKIILWGILLFKSSVLEHKNKYAILLIKILGISIISLPLFAIDDAIATRVKEFYSSVEILLFPMLIYIIKPVYTAKCIIYFYAFISIFWRLIVQKLIIY